MLPSAATYMTLELGGYQGMEKDRHTDTQNTGIGSGDAPPAV